MKLLSKRGQSTGEYAVLFAIVLGAVIAMQNYVRNRIAAGLRGQADAYEAAVGGTAAGITSASDNTSTQTATMTDALTGRLGQTGTGTSTINYPE